MICLKIAERPKALSIHLLPRCPKYLYIQFKNHFDKVIKWIYRFTKKYWYLQIWNACRQGVPFDSYHNSKDSLVSWWTDVLSRPKGRLGVSVFEGLSSPLRECVRVFWNQERSPRRLHGGDISAGIWNMSGRWGWFYTELTMRKGIQAIESSVMLKRITRSSEWW